MSGGTIFYIATGAAILTLGIIIADALLNAAEDFADQFTNWSDDAHLANVLRGGDGGLNSSRGGGQETPAASIGTLTRNVRTHSGGDV